MSIKKRFFTLALAGWSVAVVSLAGTQVAASSERASTESKSKDCAGGSAECVFCDSYSRHIGAIRQATREVGALPNGLVIHLRCDRPEAVVELQQYAFEKQKLRRLVAEESTAVSLCSECCSLLRRLHGAAFEVANSVHGVFTLITSQDPRVVRVLHRIAAEEVRLEEGVRGS